jgi:hypothetical protein
MKRSFAAILAFALVSPALAQDRQGRDDQEALVQRLIELVVKTAQDEAEKSLDRTDPDVFEGPQGQAAEEIAQRLDRRKITLDLDGLGFDEALDFVRDVTGLNVVVTPRAREAASTAKLKLRLKDVKLRNALEVLLQQTDASLRYAIRNEALQIGTTEDWKARSMVLSVIPIDDLLFAPPDFPAPEAGLDAIRPKKNKTK